MLRSGHFAAHHNHHVHKSCSALSSRTFAIEVHDGSLDEVILKVFDRQASDLSTNFFSGLVMDTIRQASSFTAKHMSVLLGGRLFSERWT